MKVLDPMAGVRLASGHPFFHIALFIGSWFALYTGRKEPPAPGEMQTAFKLLQWGHFSCFMLHLLGYLTSRSKRTILPDFEDLTRDESEALDPDSLQAFKARV